MAATRSGVGISSSIWIIRRDSNIRRRRGSAARIIGRALARRNRGNWSN